MLLTAHLFTAGGCCPLKPMKRPIDSSLLKDTQLGSGPGPVEPGLLLDREEDHQRCSFNCYSSETEAAGETSSCQQEKDQHSRVQ